MKFKNKGSKGTVEKKFKKREGGKKGGEKGGREERVEGGKGENRRGWRDRGK